MDETWDAKRIASYIDHTMLKPEADKASIIQLCEEARQYEFRTVCVNSQWVGLCKDILQGSGVGISAVCGFPLGANLADVKAFEAQQAVATGATEIDMVLQIGWLRSGEYDGVMRDITQVVKAVKDQTVVKVIMETGLLTDEQKMMACQLTEQAGADYVKTSTGYGPGGATIHDIRLLRAHVSDHIGVKASGGVRDLEAAKAMIEAGATRIGTSAGIAIMNGLRSVSDY